MDPVLTLRSATAKDAAGIARVNVDAWREAYAGIIPDDYLKRLTIGRLTTSWKKQIGLDPHVVVAVVGDEVVGFASAGDERDRDPFFKSEVFSLYVSPPAQRQGIGATLLLDTLRRLRERSPVIIWVLEDNVPARQFYEVLGGLPVRRRIEEVGGKALPQLGYAWFDL